MKETPCICSDCVNHISSPLEDSCLGCFGSICCRVGRIDGEPAYIGNVIFVHDDAFILF